MQWQEEAWRASQASSEEGASDKEVAQEPQFNPFNAKTDLTGKKHLDIKQESSVPKVSLSPTGGCFTCIIDSSLQHVLK